MLQTMCRGRDPCSIRRLVQPTARTGQAKSLFDRWLSSSECDGNHGVPRGTSGPLSRLAPPPQQSPQSRRMLHLPYGTLPLGRRPIDSGETRTGPGCEARYAEGTVSSNRTRASRSPNVQWIGRSQSRERTIPTIRRLAPARMRTYDVRRPTCQPTPAASLLSSNRRLAPVPDDCSWSVITFPPTEMSARCVGR